MPPRVNPAAIATNENLGAATGDFFRLSGGIREHQPETRVEDHHVAVLLKHVAGKLERLKRPTALRELRHRAERLFAVFPRSASPSHGDQLFGDDTLEARLVIVEPGSPGGVTQLQNLRARRGIGLWTVLLRVQRRD